jgi:hypothetical protein
MDKYGAVLAACLRFFAARLAAAIRADAGAPLGSIDESG